MSELARPRVHPFLWFDGQAEEAAAYYMAIFPNSRKLGELRNPGGAPGPKGAVMTVDFELDGQRFTAMNGGPGFPFNQAVSFVVTCRDQAEIDYYWERLTAEGGKEIQCGWCVDKYGVSWQVWAEGILELIRHPAAMQAMLGMKKFDLAALRAAAGK